MARLHSVGFELSGSIAIAPTGMEVYDYSVLSPFTIQNSVVRSGSYAMRGTGFTTATAGRARIRFADTATTGPYFSRVYTRFAAFPSVEMQFMGLMSGGSNIISASIDSSGVLTLRDEDGLVGTAGAALDLDTWYRIELHLNGNVGAGSDIARLYVDGVEVAGSSTRDIAGTVNFLAIGGNLNGEANTDGDIYFDDIAINDSTGSAQTGLPGAGKIAHAWPDGDGDADTVVTRSSGSTTPTGTDRGENWQQLGSAFDKPTPNDITDFLLLTGTTSEVLVACESAATAGIGASDTITLVHVGGRVRGVSTSGTNWIPKIMSQSSGTKVSGATVALASTTWSTNDDTLNTNQYKLTSYVDPQAGGPWTPALIDTMQIGAATTDGNPDTLVTALWALVEYVPAVATIPHEIISVIQAVNRASTY